MNIPLDYLDRRLVEATRRAAILIRLEDYELAEVYLDHTQRLREIIKKREEAVLNPLKEDTQPPARRSVDLRALEGRRSSDTTTATRR